MKVYQLQKGVVPIALYMDKKKAEKERVELDKRRKELRKQNKRCRYCLLSTVHVKDLSDPVFKHLYCNDYCPNLSLNFKYKNSSFLECENRYDDWGNDGFEVKEIEVIE